MLWKNTNHDIVYPILERKDGLLVVILVKVDKYCLNLRQLGPEAVFFVTKKSKETAPGNLS